MSILTRIKRSNSYDLTELLKIGRRCNEPRKETDILRESRPQSFELIKMLEVHVKTLSEARLEDKKRIQELERELSNCSQEIDYLQDQLNTRNVEVNSLTENVNQLEMELANMENLHVEVDGLREELNRSNSRCMFLMQELENKDLELRNSDSCLEKLEDVSLESQCEIESMKLELVALEQSCFEAKKSQEETAREKDSMSHLIQELEVRLQDVEKTVGLLEEENKRLRKKLETSETNSRLFRQKFERRFGKCLGKNSGSQFSKKYALIEQDRELDVLKETSDCGDILGPVLSKLSLIVASIADKDKMKMSLQLNEYELLVNQLKEELKEEKLKAKEEAEDLAQEMAELRYQVTGMLEEECKRRACIEQASLQRIAELEEQLRRERRKSFSAVGHLVKLGS
ncbi:hypothetical protein RJ641_009403 [Dillenia turbinata]|uniref:Uncharacterized protein n=1 Tax=Dillenia turbinata TaxID=194707 RepID=A0AAN8VCW6_9MAGN